MTQMKFRRNFLGGLKKPCSKVFSITPPTLEHGTQFRVSRMPSAAYIFYQLIHNYERFHHQMQYPNPTWTLPISVLPYPTDEHWRYAVATGDLWKQTASEKASLDETSVNVAQTSNTVGVDDSDVAGRVVGRPEEHVQAARGDVGDRLRHSLTAVRRDLASQ